MGTPHEALFGLFSAPPSSKIRGRRGRSSLSGGVSSTNQRRKIHRNSLILGLSEELGSAIFCGNVAKLRGVVIIVSSLVVIARLAFANHGLV